MPEVLFGVIGRVPATMVAVQDAQQRAREVDLIERTISLLNLVVRQRPERCLALDELGYRHSVGARNHQGSGAAFGAD
jgi:hypothetical protein